MHGIKYGAADQLVHGIKYGALASSSTGVTRGASPAGCEKKEPFHKERLQKYFNCFKGYSPAVESNTSPTASPS